MNEKVSLKIEGEEIVFADLTNRENLEAIIVCKSGNIHLFDFEKDDKKFVGKLSFDSVPNLINDFTRLRSCRIYRRTNCQNFLKINLNKLNQLKLLPQKMLIL